MPLFTSKKRTEQIKTQALIMIGCFIGASAYPLFLVPNAIAPGGITGIGTVLNHLFNWPVGLTSLLLNIPLFLMGFRSMGKSFVYRTLIATLIFSLLIDLLHFPSITDNPLLASIFGGVILGLGLGLILRASATTGGTDLLAQVVHRKYPYISVGVFLLSLDFAVILLAGFSLGAEQAMYAMICVFVYTKMLDIVLAGLGTDKACYVITKLGDEIAARLLVDVGRGVTTVKATGSYSGEQVEMLLCIVSRVEVISVKAIVNEIDPKAFVFITDTHETLGEGFRNLAEEN
ncbi:MAG: YitT family protein [Clostridiales bacterium]|nr:YitT family protein [Clostridiales bacterium]